MKKQFTKVTKTYSTKNKLQLLILNELSKVDRVLFSNNKEVSKNIITLYNNALLAYKGNAAVPPLQAHETADNDTIYYVDDVISISMYNVKTDLSRPTQ
jgi:hypothetical protein